jgi:hypothetical protein
MSTIFLKVKAGDGKVAIIAGGGAGHEPFAAGNNFITSSHLIFKKMILFYFRFCWTRNVDGRCFGFRLRFTTGWSHFSSHSGSSVI